MKNFLKTAPHQHKDPQVRLSYIKDARSDDPERQAILAELACHDTDMDVRTAAVEQLDDLTTLAGLLDPVSDDMARVVAAAQARLLSQFGAGAHTDADMRSLLDSHADRLAVSVAACASVAAQREMALAAIDDEQKLVAVVQQCRFHDTRLAAALRLSHHDALRTALNAVRSRDKVVARQLQQRLDSEAAAEAALIARRHAVHKALQSVEELTEGVWTPPARRAINRTA